MSRRKAREVALQALFQLDFNKVAQTEAIDAVLGETTILSDGSRDYAKQLVAGTQEHLSEIDSVISANLREWKVDRMSGVDRNIARIAVYEMDFAEESLAPNIIINEAIELTKRFGSDESPRFINGILGAMVKKK